MIEGIKPGGEIFVDEKQIGFLKEEPSGNGKLSDVQMQEIDSAVKESGEQRVQPKERESLPNYLSLGQSAYGQERYGGNEEQLNREKKELALKELASKLTDTNLDKLTETASRMILFQLFELIRTQEKPKKTINYLRALLEEKKRAGLSAQPSGGDFTVYLLDSLKKPTSPEYPLPRVDIGSGPVAINDSRGKTNFK